MRKGDNERYWKIGLTAVGVIFVSLLIFFAFFNWKTVADIAHNILNILAPVLLGAVIAYLLAPACNRLEGLLRRVFSRGKKSGKLFSALAIVISLLLVIVILWALAIMVIPQVCWSVIDLAMTVPGQIENAIKWVNTQLTARPELQEYLSGFLAEAERRIGSWMQTELLPTAQTVLNNVGGGILSVVTAVKNIALGFIVSIYLLGARKKLALQSRMVLYGILPARWANTVEREIRYADKMFSGFLIGKLVDSAIVGVLCFIGVTLLKYPSPLLISTIIGVTNIIPFFGPFIGAIPCALLLLLENPWHCLSFVIFILILQQLDGNVIGPKILSGSTGLSGFWVLFAILLFGGIWGFVGMIVAVPLFAVIYDVFRQLISFGLKKHGAEELLMTAPAEKPPEETPEAAPRS